MGGGGGGEEPFMRKGLRSSPSLLRLRPLPARRRVVDHLTGLSSRHCLCSPAVLSFITLQRCESRPDSDWHLVEAALRRHGPERAAAAAGCERLH